MFVHREGNCSSNVLLADVLYEAPELMASLCPKSHAALSSCSRQLHGVVRRSIANLRIPDFTHLTTIAKNDWSQLCLITVPCIDSDWEGSWPADGSLELVAEMWLDCADYDHTAIIIAPKTQQQPRHSKTAH